jgi:HSP20 family protein
MAWELTTWRPFRELDKMRGEMDRLWDAFFEGRPRKNTMEEGEWLPSVDVSETKNDLVVKAELPGMDPKDIDISLSDGLLTIKGEKKQEKEEKEENYHFIERSYGSFTRSVQLPREVKHENISASYKNGILKVVLPKSEEAKTKEIKIKVD